MPGGPEGKVQEFTTYGISSGQPTGYYIVQNDAGGNAQQLINAQTGLVVASVKLDPWGKILSSSGSSSLLNAMGFLDGELLRLVHRRRLRRQPLDRERKMAEFLDPTEEAGGDNLGVDRDNDPVNKIDPNGLLTSQIFEYFDELGKKYIDPLIVQAAHNIGGNRAAETTAQIIAASRGFNMEIAEQTDIVRQLGNIVDHPIDSYHAAGGAIDAKIAGAKQAYNETGSVAMAAGEVIGTNRIAGGMANAAGPYACPEPLAEHGIGLTKLEPALAVRSTAFRSWAVSLLAE